jgi:hypothetical protein
MDNGGALHTDEPITGSDSSPDLLNRTPFARRVAETICTIPCSSGFVISIEGPWGFGKTSVLNLIAAHFGTVTASERPIRCTFNPWMVGNVENLAQSFLIQLASAIGLEIQSDSGAKAAKEILSYSNVFSALRLIPGAEPWASIVKSVLDTVGSSVEKISDLKKISADERRAAVVSALRGINRRIVVFIDDLDRLPPDEAFEMVRLVKAVGDFPFVVYVLCLDSDYVSTVLGDKGIHKAQTYLDKVIQTRLTLPAISKDDLLRIINDEFDKLPVDARKDHFPGVTARISTIYLHGLRDLLETPRDVKRLFNRLRFAEPGCRGEVNLADLIALESIALKAPTVYQHIKDSPMAYTGNEGGYEFKKPVEIVATYSDSRGVALQPVADHLRPSVRKLLQEIFPLLRDGVDLPSRKERSGRLFADEYLAIALASGIPTGEVSFSRAVDFLRSKENREEAILDALRQGVGKRFLERLRDALVLQEQPPEDLQDLFDVLGTALDTPEAIAAEQSDDMFGARPSRILWWIVEESLQNLPKDKRADLVVGIVANTKHLSLSTLALSFLHGQHGGFDNDRLEPEDRRWIDSKALQSISERWATEVEASIIGGDAINANLIGVALYRMKRFHPATFGRVIGALIGREEMFDKVFMAIGERGVDSVKGRYARFTDTDLDAFGGKDRLREIAERRLSDDRVQGSLRFIYQALLSGKKVYLIDGTESDDD